MRSQSKKHREIVEYLMKLYDGKMTDNNPLYKGQHYPDIITKDYDIEVEMLNNSNIKRKCKIYSKDRRRILVIGVPEEFKKFFDNIILWDC